LKVDRRAEANRRPRATGTPIDCLRIRIRGFVKSALWNLRKIVQEQNVKRGHAWSGHARVLAMSSARTIRDPVQDHLLTPQNAAMIIIDFQP
jgi:hypothetical protein